MDDIEILFLEEWMLMLYFLIVSDIPIPPIRKNYFINEILFKIQKKFV